MDVSLKYKLVESIINTDDDAVLNEIQALLNIEQADFWPTLPNEVKSDIEEAKNQLDRGEGIPHHKVMQGIKNLFDKKQ